MIEPKFYKASQDGRLSTSHEWDADMVLISIEDYHGYEKAVRVVHDRAMQQIRPAITDEHGYQLISADKTYIKGHFGGLPVWRISKTTPYSIQIPLVDVKELIELDLRRYYHYMEEKDLRFVDVSSGNPVWKSMTREGFATELMKYLREPDAVEKFRHLEVPMKYILDFMDGLISMHGESFIISVEKLSANHGKGIYTVAYLATGIV